MFKEKTLDAFTSELVSKSATPGGGGASALVGAVAASLGNMVGNFTVGKERYADVEEDIKLAMDKAESLRQNFLEKIDEDAKAYMALNEVYGKGDKGPEYEKKLEGCLREAAEVPLDIFRLCMDCIEVLEEFGKKGSKIILSDAATGAILCLGAMKAAAINAKVNTKLMKDRKEAKKLNAVIEDDMEKYTERATKVYEDIYEELN